MIEFMQSLYDLICLLSSDSDNGKQLITFFSLWINKNPQKDLSIWKVKPYVGIKIAQKGWKKLVHLKKCQNLFSFPERIPPLKRLD